MFKDLIDTNFDVLGTELQSDDVKEICNLIMGGKLSKVNPDRPWLYEIVSNSRNGIDVDKFDYLRRDTHKMNVGYCSFNHEIIMKGARVVEN